MRSARTAAWRTPDKPTRSALEHDDGVHPCIPRGGVVEPEPPSRGVDYRAIVRVRDTCRRRGSRAARLPRSAGAGRSDLVLEIRIARLIERDDVALLGGERAAEVELHVLARLERKLGAERVDAVLLHVRDTHHVDR